MRYIEICFSVAIETGQLCMRVLSIATGVTNVLLQIDGCSTVRPVELQSFLYLEASNSTVKASAKFRHIQQFDNECLASHAMRDAHVRASSIK